MSHTNWEEELQLGEEDDQEIRIVLLGNPGVGKSSSGNTILGRRVFRPAATPSTPACERQRGRFSGQRLLVVDTPGGPGPRRREAARCMELAAPGPHVFLLVLEARRFTQEDMRRVRLLLGAYGEEALDFTMLLFTHGDQLTAQRVSIQTFISQSAALRGLVRECGRRRHVFNNTSSDPTQVRDLLTKIRRMMQNNGGDFFTNNMSEVNRGLDEMPDEEGEEEEEEQRQLIPVRERRPVVPAGLAGPVVPAGLAGPVVPAGPAGPVVPAGLAGPVVPAGLAGPVVPAGPAGPVVPAGPAGPVIHINNLYVNIEAQREDPLASLIQSMPWSALGAVLGLSGGPIGVALGSFGGSLAGSLLQRQAPRNEVQRFLLNNRDFNPFR